MTVTQTIPTLAERVASEAGALDGVTVLRFAHAYESGGGVEQYLHDLNHALGMRNRCTIIQVQLTANASRLAETEERVGKARVIKVPLFVRASPGNHSSDENAATSVKEFVRDRVLFAPGVLQFFTKPLMHRRKVPRRSGEPDHAGQCVAGLLERFRVDLVVSHSSGGADVSEIIEAVEPRGIPVALVHHFSNDRLRHFSVRQQAMRARLVGGVCGVDVPGYLAERFCNLSDGIDVDFFRRAAAKPVANVPPGPILFLPARLTPTKGQLDLLTIAARLKQRGLAVSVVFAGRVDSPAFEAQLFEAAEAHGIRAQVFFVGQLDTAQLRDWYAAARVLVFPTRHHEGLPRILMECQAMGLPSVAYNIGGISEAVRDGETGFLLKPGDVAGMMSVVEKLLRDAATHAATSKAARALAEQRFSLPALAQRHEHFCLQALGRPETFPHSSC